MRRSITNEIILANPAEGFDPQDVQRNFFPGVEGGMFRNLIKSNKELLSHPVLTAAEIEASAMLKTIIKVNAKQSYYRHIAAFLFNKQEEVVLSQIALDLINLTQNKIEATENYFLPQIKELPKEEDAAAIIKHLKQLLLDIKDFKISGFQANNTQMQLILQYASISKAEFMHFSTTLAQLKTRAKKISEAFETFNEKTLAECAALIGIPNFMSTYEIAKECFLINGVLEVNLEPEEINQLASFVSARYENALFINENTACDIINAFEGKKFFDKKFKLITAGVKDTLGISSKGLSSSGNFADSFGKAASTSALPDFSKISPK